MNFLKGIASKVTNEFSNPDSHLRKGIGKVTNEFTNPESNLRQGKWGGIAIHNKTDIPILVICSQLTPLHWGKVLPGETWNVDNATCHMGRVWFTVSVSVYDEKNVPTREGVAARIVALAATSIILPEFFMVPAFAAIGIASIRGVSKFGVYSDGKTLTVNGAPSGTEYALCFENSGSSDPPPPVTDPSYQLYLEAGGGGGAGGGPVSDTSASPALPDAASDGGQGVVNPVVETAPPEPPTLPAAVDLVTEGVAGVTLVVPESSESSEYVHVPEAPAAPEYVLVPEANKLSALERLATQHSSPDVVSISHPSLLGSSGPSKKY